ncbi:hypothetical protein DACRYDRAFT_113884, partial [Dacryopinax primogenitus]
MASPAPSPTSPSPGKRRFHRLSQWLVKNGNKLLKDKPLPAPPERPGTPLREETHREIVTVTPSRREGERRPLSNQSEVAGEFGYDRKIDGRDYDLARTEKYAYGSVQGTDQNPQAWESGLPRMQKHGRSASHDPPAPGRPALNFSDGGSESAYPAYNLQGNEKGLATDYGDSAIPRTGRVVSAPPPRRVLDGAYIPTQYPPDTEPKVSSNRPAITIPPDIRTSPLYASSRTLQYALAGDESPSPASRTGQRMHIQMPVPMHALPLPDAFAALSLTTPTPRSAPPETLMQPPLGHGPSHSAVSLNVPSPVRPQQQQADGRTPPRTPVKHAGRRRSSSSPASPSLAALSTLSTTPNQPTGSSDSPASRQPKMTVQCAGITKSGLSCQRQVKALSALAFLAPDEPVERYCHQHAREVLEPSGFYTRPQAGGAPRWIAYGEWIPEYLSQPTQILLRTTMESPPSVSDQPGHIYAYELRTPASEPVALKVGRAGNVKNRLGEWGRQCGKEVVLRGLWPPAAGEREGNPSLMRGRLKPGEKAPCVHRLERLIHLELADVSLYSTHLRVDFFPSTRVVPSGTTTPARGTRSKASGTPAKGSLPSSPASASKNPLRRPLTACPECGKLHREIFTFDRVGSGRAKGREWEEIVRPVIDKWGRFVEL